MAKTARRSVTSNPSTLTNSTPALQINKIGFPSNNDSTAGAHSGINYHQKNSTNISLTPSSTLDPLRLTGFHQFTTPAFNYSNRHGNRTTSTVQSYKNSSIIRGDNDNISISNNSTNSTSGQKQFNSTSTTSANRLAAERERVRMEFYATYDVMTGVRIAATLGGFFGLMVFLVVYKSRSHSNETLKILKDPKMAAVAAACMQEEEEREIQEALEATGLSLYPDDYESMLFRRQRMFSLGNVSAPPVLHRNFRFSSVGGGYSSLLEPPRRFSYSGSHRKSLSESSRILSAYPMGSSFGTDDYFIETDDELEDELDEISTREDESTDKPHTLLEVPITVPDSRRSSGMTCCSTESSYLERRCSAFTLGLSSFQKKTPSDMMSSRRSSTDMWDYYYPDIQIINPTPKVSPSHSERDLLQKVSSKVPTSANAGLGSKAENCETSIYYNQFSRKLLRKGSYNNSDSIDEEDQAIYAEAGDHKRVPRPRYDDTNELKLVVTHESPLLDNNNRISQSNNNSSSFHSIQYGESSKRAPLASLSSFKISSVDYQDSDLKSLGSDSVFVESYADTDDDMEQFSTDSDELSLSIGTDHQKIHQQMYPAEQQPTLSHKLTGISHTITTDSNKKVLSTNKRIRPTLERHRTISSTSNDRIMLISQQSQELPMQELNPDVFIAGYSGGMTTRGSSFDRSDDGVHISSIPTSSRSSGGGTGGSCTTGTTQRTDLQRPTTSFSYDNNNDSISCSSSSTNNVNRYRRPGFDGDKDNKSKCSYSSKNSLNCENVEVNVIIENRPTQVTTTISPSVILELPVITLQSQASNDEDDADPPRDPSLPGTSRKWSKETLF